MMWTAFIIVSKREILSLRGAERRGNLFRVALRERLLRFARNDREVR